MLRLHIANFSGFVAIVNCLLVPPTLGQSVSRVQEILIDASRINRSEPYVNKLFAADVQRLRDCGPSVIPELIRELAEAPPRSIRVSLLVDAIGHWRDSRALPTLLGLLSDRELRLYRGNSQLYDALAAIGTNAELALAPLALKGSSFRRQNAMSALVHSCTSLSTDVFLEAIRSRDADTMWLASVGLSKIQEKQAETELLKLLDESVSGSFVSAR